VTTLAPHPWNEGFEWPAHPGPYRRVTDDQARAYDEQGYFVLEDALGPDDVAALDAAIEPFDAEVRAFLGTQPGGRFSIAGLDTVAISPHLVVRSPALAAFCASPHFADLCHDLIGPRARLYWDQAVYKQPHSSEPVLWHQDNGYTYVEPQAYLTCWVAVTDATIDNGCVQVLPGVHRQGTVAHRNTPIGFECVTDPPEAVAVPVRAGSIVVFSSLTPHATGHNRTDSVRKAYIVQLAPDGAVVLQGDPADGPPSARLVQDDPQRQFLVTG